MIKIGSLILILSYFIVANVSATISNTNPNKGELITYELTANGEDITFPDISHIGNIPINQTGTSTSISYINGQKTQSQTKSFSFYIQNDLTIPRYIVAIDGANYQSNEIQIKINTNHNQQNQNIQLISKIDNKNLYLSQIAKLTLTIKRNPAFKILDASLTKPNLENFWVEKESQGQAYQRGNFIYQDFVYKIYPQKIGKLNIEPFRLDVLLPSKRRSSFFFSNQGVQKQIYSNALEVEVKDIPQETNIVGDFTFKVQANKKKAHANDSISLSIEIQGEGNLNDISPFNIDLANASTYSAKPEIKNNTFKQVITIISDENFTIPSLNFTYFSLKEEKLKKAKSQKINIQIDGKKNQEIFISQSNQAQEQSIKPKEITIYKEASQKQKLLYTLLGIIISIIFYVVIKLLNIIIKNKNNNQKIIIPKDEKALLSFLIPYKHNDTIKKYIEKLEENIYANKKHKINKKEIKNIISHLI